MQRACAPEATWVDVPQGLVELGFSGVGPDAGFAYDNELPQHTVLLQPCQLSSCLVSNAQYLCFVNAGGYADPGHWLAEGWEWRCEQHRDHPLYWRKQGDAWMQFTSVGLVTMVTPAGHARVSDRNFFPAHACWQFSGIRLVR